MVQGGAKRERSEILELFTELFEAEKENTHSSEHDLYDHRLGGVGGHAFLSLRITFLAPRTASRNFPCSFHWNKEKRKK